MRIIFSLLVFLSLFNPALAEEAATEGRDFLYFVTFGRDADVKLLLEQGADPNALDPQGWPMLSVAVTRKDADVAPIIETLLAAGAKINEGGPHAFYPLGVAVERDNVVAVKLLLEKGADWQLKYRGEKNSIVDLGRMSHNTEISQALQAVENEYLKQQAYLMSDANRIRLLGDYIFAQCGRDYWEYILKNTVISSGEQSPYMQTKIAAQHEKMVEAAKEMTSMPKYLEQDKLKKLSRMSKIELYKYFAELRQKKNIELASIANDEEMERRCKVITAPWFKWIGYYDFQGLGLTRPASVKAPY